MSDPINNPNIEWDEENQVFRGKFIVGQDNDIVFKVKDDKTIDEGNETLNISIQNINENDIDSITGKSVNDSSVKSKNVNIVDSSRSPKFLSLVSDKNTLNENEILIPSPQQYDFPTQKYQSYVNDNTKLTLTATGQDFLIADDGQIEFEVVGTSGNIDASDFNPNNLRGYLTVQNNTTAVGELFINQDFLEEGEERFRVRIVDNPLIQTDEIVILDTSIPQPVFQSIDIVPIGDPIADPIFSGDFANDSEGWLLENATHSTDYGGSIKLTRTGLAFPIMAKVIQHDFIEGVTYKFRIYVEDADDRSYLNGWINRVHWIRLYDFSDDSDPIGSRAYNQYASKYFQREHPGWWELEFTCNSLLASKGKVLFYFISYNGTALPSTWVGGYEVIDTSINYSVEGKSFHVYLNGQNLTNYSYPQTYLSIPRNKNDDASTVVYFDNPDGNNNWSEAMDSINFYQISIIPESRFNDDSRILLDTIKILFDDNVNNSNREFTLFFEFYKMVDNFTYVRDSLSSEFIVLPDIPVYDSFVASPSTVNETDNNVVTLTLSGTNITYEDEQIEFRIGESDNSSGLSSSDFDPPQLYGNLTGIDRNTATGTITIAEDNLDENVESFYCYLSSNSNIRTNDVTILDTSAPYVWEITPSSLKVSEGSSLSIDVTATNVDPLELPTPGTAYWAVLDKPEDFETSSGSFSMQGSFSNSSGQFSVTPSVDSDTTPEDFRVAVRTSPNGNNEVVSEPIKILADAIYTVTPRNNQTSVDEGSSITFDVLVENVDTDEYNAIKNNSVSNTHGNYVHQPILGWQINHPNLSGDFNLPTDYYVQLSIDDSSKLSNGTATLSGSFSVSVKDDNLSEPNPETFNVEIFRLPVSYANDVNNWTSKNTSVNITINDTSTSPESYSITPDSYTISEGSILNVSVDVQNINPSDLPTPGKLYWEINHITTESDDFQVTSGELDVSGDFYNSNGTFQINVSENFEDYDETFTISIKKSPSSSALVTSPIITITGTEILFNTLTTSHTLLNETNNRTTTITLTGTNLNGSYRCTIEPANNSNITPSDFYDPSALYVWLYTNGSTTEATGTITVNYDRKTEGTEYFYVQLDDESQGIIRTVDIEIDDTSLTPTYADLYASNYSLNETTNKTTTITLTGTNLHSGDYSHHYACTIVPVNNSNITISDFSGGVWSDDGILGVTLVSQNSTTATRTITIAEDSTIEGTEIFYVQLNEDPSKKTNNITINDITVVTPTYNNLVASDYSLDETTNKTTTITLTGTNLSGSYGCTIRPANSSDITGADFTSGDLNVTLTSNSAGTQATGTITVREDFTTEQTEYFYVELDAEPSIKTNNITIIDTSKDPVVTPTYNNLVASDYSLDETTNKTTTITLTGTNLSGSYGCTIRPANSSDITGADFTSGDLNVTLTSNSAGTQATGTITVREDFTTEQTEYFYVELDAEPSIKTNNITIIDTSKDPVVTPTFNNLVASPTEIYEWTDLKTTTITLNGTNLSGSYTCSISGTNIAPSDFNPSSLSVTLNTTNGSTTEATGTITANDDSYYENTETFRVSLDDDPTVFVDIQIIYSDQVSFSVGSTGTDISTSYSNGNKTANAINVPYKITGSSSGASSDYLVQYKTTRNPSWVSLAQQTGSGNKTFNLPYYTTLNNQGPNTVTFRVSPHANELGDNAAVGALWSPEHSVDIPSAPAVTSLTVTQTGNWSGSSTPGILTWGPQLSNATIDIAIFQLKNIGCCDFGSWNSNMLTFSSPYNYTWDPPQQYNFPPDNAGGFLDTNNVLRLADDGYWHHSDMKTDIPANSGSISFDYPYQTHTYNILVEDPDGIDWYYDPRTYRIQTLTNKKPIYAVVRLKVGGIVGPTTSFDVTNLFNRNI